MTALACVILRNSVVRIGREAFVVQSAASFAIIHRDKNFIYDESESGVTAANSALCSCVAALVLVGEICVLQLSRARGWLDDAPGWHTEPFI
jgi:hypothetical protein